MSNFRSTEFKFACVLVVQIVTSLGLIDVASSFSNLSIIRIGGKLSYQAFLREDSRWNLRRNKSQKIFRKQSRINSAFSGYPDNLQPKVIPFFLNDDRNQQSDLTLYLHVPYCRRRCRYCDFAIIPIGNSFDEEVNFESSLDELDSSLDEDGRALKGFRQMDLLYRNAVLREIELLASSLYNNSTSNANNKLHLKSIYFGGGTPSLAPDATLIAFLEAIRKHFFIVKEAEITIEMDPGTFGKDKLCSVLEMGFNRVSLGVQSFNDTILAALGRVHRSNDVYESVRMLRKANLTYGYSIDLISGLPGVTPADWVTTLQAGADLEPSHMSVYDLQIEEGTAFGKWFRENLDDDRDEDNIVSLTQSKYNFPKIFPLPSGEDSAFMYKFTSGYLRARGFEHYEISSYASSGSRNRSKHNSHYWAPNANWLAVGLGSSSCIGSKRFSRPRQMSDYVSWIIQEEETYHNQGTSWMPPWIPTIDDISLELNLNDERDQLSNLQDILLTRLRTADGLDMNWIEKEFGSGTAAKILNGAALALELGLAQVEMIESTDLVSDQGTLRLKDPDGFVFSNTIISGIFAELISY